MEAIPVCLGTNK